MRKNNKQIRRQPRAHSHTHTYVNFPVDFINVCWIVFHKHVYFTFLHSLLNMFVIISTLAGFFLQWQKTTHFVFVCGIFTHLIDCHIRNFLFFAHWTHTHSHTLEHGILSLNGMETQTHINTQTHIRRGRNGESERANARATTTSSQRQKAENCMTSTDYLYVGCGHTILCYD